MFACLAVLAFFFFQSFRHPLDLHSFPTRRSSDLDIRLGPSTGAIVQAAVSRGIPFRRLTAGRDRKSTRLNSSHLGISYAVFCLEKKISAAITSELLLSLSTGSISTLSIASFCSSC